MKKYLAVIAALCLAACTTAPEVKNAGSVVTSQYDSAGKLVKQTEERTDYAAYLKTFEGGGAAAAHLVDVECAQTGCPGLKLTVYAPQGGNHAVPQAPVVPESDAWKVWHEVKEMTVGVAGIAFPWTMGARVLTQAFHSATQPVTTTTTNTTNTATNVTASGAGASAAAGGSASSNYSKPTNTMTIGGTNNAGANGGSATSTGPRTCATGPGASGGSGGGTTTGGAGGSGAPSGPATC